MTNDRAAPLSTGPLAAWLSAAIAFEAVYLIGRSHLPLESQSPVMEELIRTAWRLPFCPLYWYLARLFVPGPRAPWKSAWHPLVSVSAVLGFLAWPLAGYTAGPGLATHLVFALTTPIVAVREELFYRAILQGGLERFVGRSRALAIATIAFAAFHYGAQPINLFTVLLFIWAGLLFGAVYQRTRDIRLPILLHAAFDVIVALSPGMALIPYAVLVLALGAAIVLLVAWSIYVPPDTSQGGPGRGDR